MGFLRSSCFSTLSTTAIKIKEVKPDTARIGYEDLAVKSANGPDMTARKPMGAGKREGETGRESKRA